MPTSKTEAQKPDQSDTERMRAALVEYDKQASGCRIDGSRPQRDTMKNCDRCGAGVGDGCGLKAGAAYTFIKTIRALAALAEKAADQSAATGEA